MKTEFWKIIKTDMQAGQLIETTTELSSKKMSKSAAKNMINKMVSNKFNFIDKPFHGFGGYWRDSEGNTIEAIPSFK